MLTDNQKQFTEAALEAPTSGILIDRVQEIYRTKNRKTAQVIARQNFLKPNIEAYLGDRGYKALDVLTEAMNTKKASWSDRITAANSIADRQFGKATQKIEQTTTGVTLTIDLTSSLDEQT